MSNARHPDFQVTGELESSVRAFPPQMHIVEFLKRIFSERSAILQRDEKPMTVNLQPWEKETGKSKAKDALMSRVSMDEILHHARSGSEPVISSWDLLNRGKGGGFHPGFHSFACSCHLVY